MKKKKDITRKEAIKRANFTINVVFLAFLTGSGIILMQEPIADRHQPIVNAPAREAQKSPTAVDTDSPNAQETPDTN